MLDKLLFNHAIIYINDDNFNFLRKFLVYLMQLVCILQRKSRIIFGHMLAIFEIFALMFVTLPR